MITRKQCPFQSPTPTRALVRLRADHVSDGATASFQLPLVCCKGIIPANPLFSSVHPTHTAASLNTGTTTSGVNERSASKEIIKKKNCCVASQRIVSMVNLFSSNPWPVIKKQRTADGNDAFSHKAVFLMSVCDLFRVIGSLRWRAEV